MATVTESSESQITSARDNNLTGNSNARVLDETATFIDDAVRQAQFYQKALNDAVESALDASITRFSQIRSTSYAHFNQTLDSLDELKSQYNAYEDILFGKIKDGALVAASQPAITCGATAALGLVVLKRPRRMLYYNTLRLFVSEESLISRASAEVNELRKSIDLLKAEGEKLQKSALHAEEQLLRGRTKLRQAGKQIRYVINSAHKIERKAGGLKDILGELPRREASYFRSQVSKLAYEAKQEKNSLTKEKGALHAEEQLLLGRTKHRQAGKQITNVINSTHKIERKARGLKDILGELPRSEASYFRSHVSKLAYEEKQEKNSLTKEVTKLN